MKKQFVYAVKREAQKQMGEDVTWGELLAALLAHRRKLKRGEKYLYDLENALGRATLRLTQMGVMRPFDMSKRSAVAYLDDYKNQGVADITVQHMAVKLMTLFTFAYEEEWLDSDRLATLKKPPILDKKKHAQVTMDEIGQVVDCIEKNWSPEFAPASRFRGEDARKFFPARDICMTLWMPETGARIGETCAVLLDDVDLKERTALFRNTKNGDDRLGFFTETFAETALADWLAIRTQLECLSPYLFVSELGLKLDPYRWGRQWDRYRQKSGIERRIRRHDLRHFASTAHDRVDRSLSKVIIGHKTDQAHDIYDHPEIAHLREAHDKAAPVDALLEKRKIEAEAARLALEPAPPVKKVYGKKAAS